MQKIELTQVTLSTKNIDAPNIQDLQRLQGDPKGRFTSPFAAFEREKKMNKLNFDVAFIGANRPEEKTIFFSKSTRT